MAELPFHLKTIETLPGALDILRFLGESEGHTADVDEICDTLELSDRRFSKAIRRLVTKGYVIMDGDMVYRLSEQGEEAVDELAEYDEAEGIAPLSERMGSDSEDSDEFEAVLLGQNSSSASNVKRRLVMAIPKTLTANQPSNIIVGFSPASDGNTLPTPADMLLRLSVVHGEPEKAKDITLTLENASAQEIFDVVPGAYTQMRLKVEVMQLDNFSGDITKLGGMYVDVDVSNLESDSQELVAYGVDVNISA